MTHSPALHARFLRGLGLAPGAPAVSFGEHTLTYEALHELACRWAGALLATATPPRRVGVLAEKGTVAYAGILAALYAGAACVPLHPSFPAVRTRWMLEDAEVSVVIADDAGAATLASSGMDVRVLQPNRGDAADAAPAEPAPAAPEDLAYVLFTSGSTGRPKGVPLSHGNLASYFSHFDPRYGFDRHDVFAQTLELNFDCSLCDMFGAWGVGAAVRTIPAPAFRDLPGYLAEHGVTVWFSTPSSIGLVRRMGGLAAGALGTLRTSFFAGEALLCSDADAWQQAAPASIVENLYGPAELTITVTGHRWSPETSPKLAVNGIVPIGKVHEGHDHRLVDDDGEPAAGEGELCITGPQMSSGYLNPDHDLGRFVKHGTRTWYRTGDRVRRLPNGELAYLGRRDGQVQLQGLRVELSEVEHAVRACDGVTAAVVVPFETHGETALAAFYTGAPAQPVALARRLRELLPAAMVPRRFTHVEEFPLNTNRKVDRGALARRATT